MTTTELYYDPYDYDVDVHAHDVWTMPAGSS